MKLGLIPAAGGGRRLDLSSPKELVAVDGKAVIEYSVDTLLDAGVDKVVVVIREGKEQIRTELQQIYPTAPFEFVYQEPPIGRLLDAIKASYPVIKGHEVYFCMADTIIAPNPFSIHPSEAPGEIALLCFHADGDSWRHFGVIDAENSMVVDKPETKITDVCWGALMWRPEFTERLLLADDLTDAINAADWTHRVTIDHYTDIGLGPRAFQERQSRVAS